MNLIEIPCGHGNVAGLVVHKMPFVQGVPGIRRSSKLHRFENYKKICLEANTWCQTEEPS